jgi:trehalose-6-phosphatase
MIVEVCVGWNKGSFVADIAGNLSAADPSCTFICVGDDKTDEDMFGALESGFAGRCATCVVGSEERSNNSNASYRLADCASVRSCFFDFVDQAQSKLTASASPTGQDS